MCSSSYCFVIQPVNYSLAAVNFFVGSNGLVQLARIAQYVPPTYAAIVIRTLKLVPALSSLRRIRRATRWICGQGVVM